MNGWSSKKKILVILAHPDDPDFFCGGTIAQWIKSGHHVDYLLMTKGEKGINDDFDDPLNIIEIRNEEQRNAADILGVGTIDYLDYEDGTLVASIDARERIVASVRTHKPDIVVTCDPTNYYMNDNYINHPDHRAAGQIVVDAVFPGVQNKLYFPALAERGLEPHRVEEAWIALPKNPNVTLDVTKEWSIKIKALECHQSQIGNKEKFRKHMDSKGILVNGKLRFEEKFHRIVFR
jgi:LmbE family N-acetylglucosaminyl deacetylase